MRKIGKILVLIMTTFSCVNGAALSGDQPSLSFEDLKEDSKFLKDIANTILSRPQDIQAMQEGMRKKHGVRSFELWRDCFDANDTWGPAWGKLDSKTQDELKKIFGSKGNAEMIMKRDTFILVDDDIMKSAKTSAEGVVEKGTPVLGKSPGNQKRPYVITIRCKFPRTVGKIHRKQKDGSFLPPIELTDMYIVFNVSDILNQILKSKKNSIEERKNDWNKAMDGYIATFTPTESPQVKE